MAYTYIPPGPPQQVRPPVFFKKDNQQKCKETSSTTPQTIKDYDLRAFADWTYLLVTADTRQCLSSLSVCMWMS